MTKERKLEIKEIMRKEGVKHYIYGGLMYNASGLAKYEFTSGYCCYDDKELEQTANALYKRGFETLHTIHA